ncbi:TIR domain-containing protein [Mucilaginibacter paludis]|uniref:TIR domain-containing protein n=1 Tax=Mucilaginibacter paludis DSM 18603 TaxID=714943 RepID=H1Y181_9SPHI|nr:hypothetical protein [Mucilaginibacter paludis]EHQ29716.1 hypothetical protein Mucpa_5647 [Mucilaginibacter paludis DSM 18603]
MSNHFKCFLSASYEANVTLVSEILEERQIEVFDLYEHAIGSSFQEILKRKLRQADFAIFVITPNNRNVLYEIGVCEGLGKEYFVIVDKKTEVPFYLENQLSLTANLEDKDFLGLAIDAFLQEWKSKKRKPTKTPAAKGKRTEAYNDVVLSC